MLNEVMTLFFAIGVSVYSLEARGARTKLIHADTREVFYRYSWCLKFKATRNAVWISRASENLGDACGELHHNAEE